MSEKSKIERIREVVDRVGRQITRETPEYMAMDVVAEAFSEIEQILEETSTDETTCEPGKD